MKINRQALLFSALLSVSMSLAHAEGTKEGGGGAGLVCTSGAAPVQFLDFAELLAIGSAPQESNAPVEIQIKKAFLKFAQYFPVRERGWVLDILRAAHSIVAAPERVDWLTQGPRLAPPIDTGLSTIPDDCFLIGIAKYADRENRLTIDRRYYDRLTATGKAGLWVHETLWWIARRYDQGHKTLPVDRTLHKVADLLSDPSFFDGLPTPLPDSIRTRKVVGNLFTNRPLKLIGSPRILKGMRDPGKDSGCYFEYPLRERGGYEWCRELTRMSDARTVAWNQRFKRIPAFAEGRKRGFIEFVSAYETTLDSPDPAPWIKLHVDVPEISYREDVFEFNQDSPETCVERARSYLKLMSTYSINFHYGLDVYRKFLQCRIEVRRTAISPVR